MSSEPFVRASGLGKDFALYDSAWQRFADACFGGSRGRRHVALSDVDLDVRPGDCVGIVGRNGAGKSTLLELICGILRPSHGSVETRGRIAALLQLGAGFNPEFTGRENVFLSAALYGLSAADIAGRLPRIEAFAGIGDFIDRPVRDYSSGMYARLAFSVCANVDADILVVDEILGVGDVRFQQKSMRFLRQFRRRGIVFFVSHNEHSVAALCNTALWIDNGRVAARGATRDVLYLYRRELSRLMGPDGRFSALDGEDVAPPAVATDPQLPRDHAFDPDDPPLPSGDIGIESVALRDVNGEPVPGAAGGEALDFSVSVTVAARVELPYAVFVVRNPLGQIVFAGDSRDAQGAADQPTEVDDGDALAFSFRFTLPFLPTGSYPFDVFCLSGSHERPLCHDMVEHAAVLQVASRHISSGMANLVMERTRLLAGAEAN